LLWHTLLFNHLSLTDITSTMLISRSNCSPIPSYADQNPLHRNSFIPSTYQTTTRHKPQVFTPQQLRTPKAHSPSPEGVFPLYTSLHLNQMPHRHQYGRPRIHIPRVALRTIHCEIFFTSTLPGLMVNLLSQFSMNTEQIVEDARTALSRYRGGGGDGAEVRVFR
jgi:hypothetical protein